MNKMDAVNEQKDLTMLRELNGYLQELELEGQLMERSVALPMSVLVVPFGSDDKDRPRILTLTYIPDPEGFFQHISLLQLLIELPFAINEKNRLTLLEAITRVNQKIAVGSYYLDDNNKIGLRNIITTYKFKSIDKDLFLETINLFIGMLDYTASLVEEVNDGTQQTEAILAELF
jgi:hypothetical protein